MDRLLDRGVVRKRSRNSRRGVRAAQSRRSGREVYVVVLRLDRPVIPQRIFRPDSDHRGHPVFTPIGGIIEANGGLTESSAGEAPIVGQSVLLMGKGKAALRVDEPSIGR